MYVKWKDRKEVDTLVGLTLESIEGMNTASDQVVFKTTCGRTFLLYHEQDCCERVDLVDVAGDPEDLIGTPITVARLDENAEGPPFDDGYTPESFTWSFYNIGTVRGTVTLRWLGESNGYYSESVDFGEVTS